MARRPCITPGCNRLAAPGKPRCPGCNQVRERRRGTRQQRGYDADYDRARRDLHLEQGPPCHWGCGRVATTADHSPPMAQAGPHTRLVPACSTCNSAHVSARANAADGHDRR